MGYRLEAAETLPDGLRRIAGEQLEGAVAALRGETDLAPDKAVHDARKRVKKTRAVLRLTRAELGSEVYRRENTRLRDGARRLGAARDGAVLVETLEGVAVAVPAEVAHGLAPVADVLRRRRDAAEAELFDRSNAVAEVAEVLTEACEQIAAWPLERDRFKAVAPGLRRAYGRGAARFAEAREDPDAERLHEWRKQVKDLWYQARILEPSWPEGLGGLVSATDELADLLGVDHDLSVLHETLLAEVELVTEPGVLDAALAVIGDRREEIQARAFASGERLYAEKPGAFVRRLRAYWRAWRAESARAVPVL